ncbi:MAG: V-type ATP synthase subunit K, partial [Spirochaetota bacterium]
FLQNRPAPFMLIAFVGAPLTQTIYGFILMNTLREAAAETDPMMLLGGGILGGIAMGFSAWFQGKSGAAASDALAETGKGFGNYIMVLGLIETVALFVMVFLMGVVG